jgi:hypothetical protein
MKGLDFRIADDDDTIAAIASPSTRECTRSSTTSKSVGSGNTVGDSTERCSARASTSGSARSTLDILSAIVGSGSASTSRICDGNARDAVRDTIASTTCDKRRSNDTDFTRSTTA